MKMADIIKKCRELAAKYPGAKYVPPSPNSSCFYTSGDVMVDDKTVCKGCILGNAIRLADSEFYDERLSDEPAVGFGEFSDRALAWEILEDNEAELSWLQCVQDHQDRGEKWSSAVDIADQAFPLG